MPSDDDSNMTTNSKYMHQMMTRPQNTGQYNIHAPTFLSARDHSAADHQISDDHLNGSWGAIMQNKSDKPLRGSETMNRHNLRPDISHRERNMGMSSHMMMPPQSSRIDARIEASKEMEEYNEMRKKNKSKH